MTAASPPLTRTPPLMRDERLPHQIVIATEGGGTGQIFVSCNCRRVRREHPGPPTYRPLAVRFRWDAADAVAVYNAHLPSGVT